MNKNISIEDFKNKKEDNTIEKLTKSGKSFRERFEKSLKELENKFDIELENAIYISDIKIKINISSVVKNAKSSPLAAYSDNHKDFVSHLVNNAVRDCNKKLENKFKDYKKPTIESLQKQLSEERELYKAELSKITSQKMSEYLNLNDGNI